MDTSYPARIEDDPFENLEDTDDIFQNGLRCQHYFARTLAVCGIAAICQKRGYKTGHIAADGSVYNKYPGFKEEAAKGLRDIYGWTR
ncbi:hexokinase [Fusarium falciforme]|nr:hexokinase [Fusarium falciforme]